MTRCKPSIPAGLALVLPLGRLVHISRLSALVLPLGREIGIDGGKGETLRYLKVTLRSFKVPYCSYLIVYIL